MESEKFSTPDIINCFVWSRPRYLLLYIRVSEFGFYTFIVSTHQCFSNGCH